jgi:hypothetical protein
MLRTLFVCCALVTAWATSAGAICGQRCPPALGEVKECGVGSHPPCTCTCEGFIVIRFTTSILTNADADRILADATRVLSQKDGPSDIACGAKFVRNEENVLVTNVPANGIINSPTDLDLILVSIPGNAKRITVVNQINYCSGFKPNIIGCSRQGTSQAVVRYIAAQEGILWAHEYGHTRGLPDLPLTSSTSVMNGTIGANRLQVTNGECASFRR